MHRKSIWFINRVRVISACQNLIHILINFDHIYYCYEKGKQNHDSKSIRTEWNCWNSILNVIHINLLRHGGEGGKSWVTPRKIWFGPLPSQHFMRFPLQEGFLTCIRLGAIVQYYSLHSDIFYFIGKDLTDNSGWLSNTLSKLWLAVKYPFKILTSSQILFGVKN